jgi:phosphoribosylformylglycinamidine cyclo-ligase
LSVPEKSGAAASAERYREAGVAPVNEQPGFISLIDQLRQTFGAGGRRPLLDFGHFANVLDLGGPQAIAISTDGVGTKAIVAQMLDKYDTIGIDCVAMNANDILCVGAEPIAMVDYIAIEAADDRLLSEIGNGLVEGARLANIVVPGGEISQIPQIIRSERPGFGFDLVGTCIGTVDKDRLVTGANIEQGDVIVGLASSGIHSNGFTLARKALFEGRDFGPDQHVPELGRSLGEELLEPTRIYVPEVLQVLREGLPIKALVHNTSDGLLNLARVSTAIGFVIEWLPEPPPIFSLIQAAGGVSDREMFLVYNMGVGFCVITSSNAADRVIAIAQAAGYEAWRLGHCTTEPEKTVELRPKALVGRNGRFAAV